MDEWEAYDCTMSNLRNPLSLQACCRQLPGVRRHLQAMQQFHVARVPVRHARVGDLFVLLPPDPDEAEVVQDVLEELRPLAGENLHQRQLLVQVLLPLLVERPMRRANMKPDYVEQLLTYSTASVQLLTKSYSSTSTEAPRSGPSRYECKVCFQNVVGYDVDIYWIKKDGRSVLYKTLPPGHKVSLNTFVGHLWHFCHVRKHGVEWLQADQQEIYKAIGLNDRRGRPLEQAVNIVLPLYSLQDLCKRYITREVPRRNLKHLNLPNAIQDVFTRCHHLNLPSCLCDPVPADLFLNRRRNYIWSVRRITGPWDYKKWEDSSDDDDDDPLDVDSDPPEGANHGRINEDFRELLTRQRVDGQPAIMPEQQQNNHDNDPPNNDVDQDEYFLHWDCNDDDFDYGNDDDDDDDDDLSDDDETGNSHTEIPRTASLTSSNQQNDQPEQLPNDADASNATTQSDRDINRDQDQYNLHGYYDDIDDED